MSETTIPEANKKQNLRLPSQHSGCKGPTHPIHRVIARTSPRVRLPTLKPGIASCGVSSKAEVEGPRNQYSLVSESLMKAFPRRLTTPWPLSAQPLRKH